MKELSIFIDFSGEATLANQLKKKLKSIEGISTVKTYDDLDETLDGVEDDDWEKITINAVKKNDIIIPILSEGYLGYLTSEIESLYENIIDSQNQFLLPVLKTPSEWSSHKWVVRSKLFPSNNKAFSELSSDEFETEANDLIKTVKNIIKQLNDVSENALNDSIDIDITSGEKFIFISHNHEDADFAELLKLTFEKKGIKCWIDNERLKIGQDWREGIDLGIQNSTAVIAIMTPEARKSEYVTYEWAFAWGKGKKIFPIMLKQTQLHPRLESLQYLDFTNRASRPWDELIKSILKITS